MQRRQRLAGPLPSRALIRGAGGSGIGVGNRAQVFVDGTQVVVAHALEYRPGHDLQQRTELRVRVIEVGPHSQDLLEPLEGQARRAGRPEGASGVRLRETKGPKARPPARKWVALMFFGWPR